MNLDRNIENVILTILDEGNYEEELNRDLEKKLQEVKDLDIDDGLRKEFREKVSELKEDTENHSEEVESLIKEICDYIALGTDTEEFLVMVLEVIEKETIAETIYGLAKNLAKNPELKETIQKLQEEEKEHKEMMCDFLQEVIDKSFRG